MKKKEKKNVEKIRKDHKLDLILLHGSVVTGKTHTESDIDIAVLPKKNINIRLLDLIRDFSKVYLSDKIDITDLSKADPLLLYAVATKSRLISGSVEGYKAFKLKAYKRYIDYQKYLEIERKTVLRNLQKYL